MSISRNEEPGKADISGVFPASEPYGPLSGLGFTGKRSPFSPDLLHSYRWENPRADDDLEIFSVRPAAVTAMPESSFPGAQALTHEGPGFEVTGPGTLRLDFGAEFAGWLELDSPDLEGGVLLSISEYNEPEEVNLGPRYPVKTAKPVRYGSTWRLELNDLLFEGVRFGFLHVVDFVRPFHIKAARLVCQTKPVNYNGSFDSSNELLNRIWYTAAYDVRVNLQRDYFSAILVDRGDRISWTGDAHVSQAAALTAFGNTDFVLKNLRFTAAHGNGIESYEMYWIFSLIDYYEYTGDTESVHSLLPEAFSRLDHAAAVWGTNPKLNYFGADERLGAVFENPNLPGNQIAFKMLCLQAWRKFAGVLNRLGERDAATRYTGIAAEKADELRRSSLRCETLGLHAFCDAVNAGFIDPEHLRVLGRKHFSDRVSRLSFSPFSQYFILQAMAAAGFWDEALGSILDLWGGQIDYGATTFFEVYRPQWNDFTEKNAPLPNNQTGFTSLAHPWSAGVLPWLSKEVLGIHALTPGFARFAVRPHLGSLLDRVSGSIPTPFGPAGASFDLIKGQCSVSVPEGTSADLFIPKAGKRITGVTRCGAPIQPTGEDKDFFILHGLPVGNHSFEIHYEGRTPAFIMPSWKYKAEFVGEDTATGGNWRGVYGADGYCLFACGENGGDNSVLPGYISELRIAKAKRVCWETEASDRQALESPFGGPRRLGALLTNNPIACDETFTVDVLLRENRLCTMALYFADRGDTDRRQAVEMFDAETLELAAPVREVRDFTDGRYLIYRYDRSVRFRIDHIRGCNAALSAIFFD